MSLQNNSELGGLIDDVTAVANEAQATFGSLTPSQLNWKPAPEQWSVGQVFEHLIKTHQPYVPILEQVLRGERRASVWERVSPLSGFWGRVVRQAVSPESQRKVKARPRFQPPSSSVDVQVVSRFASVQYKLAELMTQTETLRPEKIIITSPVAGLVTYSLLDAYKIVRSHARRHFAQAQRVTQADAFPRSQTS